MDTMATEIKENKMGTMPVNKLLFSMAIPMIISMLVQALYNIVDSAFVAQISEDALSAVSLAFPMQNFMIAVATGTGVGVNAMLSKNLGAQRHDVANKTANVSIFLAIVNWLVFVVIGIFCTNIFLRGQTSVQAIIDYGDTYLRICLIGSLGVFGQVTFERLLQGTGRTVYSMISQLVGAIINIVLDPILIFGWFGVPAMGVAGAAIATVIGQFAGMGFGFYFNLKKNHDLQLNLRSLKAILPDFQMLRNIYYVAVPSILMVSIGSVMVFFMNRILNNFTPTAIAVLGSYFKLQSFIFMPVFGINNAMVPIIAYNYGARKKARIMETMRICIISATVLMTLGFLAFQFLPDKLLAIFNASESMLEIGVPALRIISPSFLLAGCCIIMNSVFQALGNGFYSLLVSVSRQLLALLPIAYAISLFGNLNQVWFAFPLAELVSTTLVFVFFKRIKREKLNFD